MTNKAIIHISDLHISIDSSVSNLNINNSVSLKDKVKAFENTFIKVKEDNIKNEELFLIISGDIANSGHNEEYDFAIKFINKLKIKKENTLIIPGNHDINWADNELAYAQDMVNNKGNRGNVKKKYEFQTEKFQKFTEFYNSFFKNKKKFNPEKIIVDKIILKDEKLLILGLNSCYKCNYDNLQGVGYIDFNDLDKELKKLPSSLNSFSKVAVCHHNPFVNYVDNPKNGFEKGNWQRVKEILNKYNINTILFGHEHAHGTNTLNDDSYLSVGSLSRQCEKNESNEFNVIEINSNNPFTLSTKHYSHICSVNVSQPDGYWSFLPHSPNNRIVVINKKPQKEEINTDPLIPEISQTKVIERKLILKEETLTPVENEFHPEIFKRIKELKVFKSGHFHWSDNSRAHNWIDTPKLLNKKEDIFLIQKSILKSIEDNKIEFDLIIGLGIEGNIIASRCATTYDIPYTYLPYSYRYDDHASYEKEMKLKNYNFKKILIITDVVHDGKTIKNILQDESEFFNHCKKVEEINVVTLFFTGEEYNINLLNDSVEKRFNFYYVSRIRVEECPYKRDSDWENKCAIYCHKLDKVYEFYNKKII